MSPPTRPGTGRGGLSPRTGHPRPHTANPLGPHSAPLSVEATRSALRLLRLLVLHRWGSARPLGAEGTQGTQHTHVCVSADGRKRDKRNARTRARWQHARWPRADALGGGEHGRARWWVAGVPEPRPGGPGQHVVGVCGAGGQDTGSEAALHRAGPTSGVSPGVVSAQTLLVPSGDSLPAGTRGTHREGTGTSGQKHRDEGRATRAKLHSDVLTVLSLSLDGLASWSRCGCRDPGSASGHHGAQSAHGSRLPHGHPSRSAPGSWPALDPTPTRCPRRGKRDWLRRPLREAWTLGNE